MPELSCTSAPVKRTDERCERCESEEVEPAERPTDDEPEPFDEEVGDATDLIFLTTEYERSVLSTTRPTAIPPDEMC
jgi:hypothetical protein